jgi:hypothetical protein
VDSTTENDFVDFILGGEPDQEEAADTNDDTEAAPLDATDEDTGEEAPSEETEAEDADEYETEETDAQDQPRLFTVKVNGVEKQVTEEELKRSYSGQDYIQQRMQEAAAKVKEAEQLSQTLAQERQAILAMAQQLSTQGVMPVPKAPDPKLADSDPIKYMKDHARYQAELGAWHNQQAQIQALQHRQAQMSDVQRRQQLAENAERLKADIPDFADPQKAEALRRKLLSYGQKEGYSETELLSVDDPRAVKVLRKAALWDELQAQKAKPVQQAAPKVVKPKATRPQVQSDGDSLKRALKTQDPADLAKWLMSPTQR